MPYSTRLAVTFLTSSSITSFFTAPAGYVTVLRDLQVGQEEGGPGDFSLYAVGNPGSTNALIVTYPALTSTQTGQWQGRLVLNAGDELAGSVSAGGFTVWASGYLLDL